MATTKSTNKKTVPLGKPLNRTDAQLDELSKVTPDDIEQAQALWRNSVPAKFKTLLDAQPIESKTPAKPKGKK